MAVRCLKAWIGLLVRGFYSIAAPLLCSQFSLTDAIDNISTKVDLLHHCHSRSIKVRHPCVLLDVSEH